jgi:hypothetical protein
VVKELRPILDGNDCPAQCYANEHHTALGCWLDEDFPLSYSSSVLPYHLWAVVNTNGGNAKLELVESHYGQIPLSYLVNLIITQCRMPNSHCHPPFITGGNFLAVMRVTIDEMVDCAVQACILSEETNTWVSQAITHACNTLKINYVSW